MEVIALIATALATGVAAGVQASTSEAVGRVYARLRQRVRERLGGRAAELDDGIAAQQDRDTSAPDPVAPELRRQPADARVWISDSKWIVIGDNTHQVTTINTPAPPVTPGEGGM
ncbi:hypothetical protein [Streptomyces sp. NBC_00648]|uniref:hypothetical protein n=1 Tax=Streptomyces sp. NBC_00648 TaxID=2975797 RepID=UPI0032472FFB